MKKFILHPGFSTTEDGTEEYVTGKQLVERYEIDIEDCILATAELPQSIRSHPSLINLYPCKSNNYKETLENFLKARSGPQ